MSFVRGCTRVCALLLCGFLAACERGEGSAREPAPIERTEDGEEIIRAPARPPPPPRTERLVLDPIEPDPHAGRFTVEEATAGLSGEGSLVAEITTDLGTLLCDLDAERAPLAVASFVGLARGRRAYWDPRAGMYRRGPYYRGTAFHRVIPGYLIQGGDLLEDGTGNVGFSIPHEPGLRHDRAGRLAMATRAGEPGSGGAQIYITDGAAPQLDGTATVFGQCRPLHLVAQIARVPQSGAPDHRPLTPVRIARVTIRRVEGGAENARPSRPILPPGEPEVPRGASPGPSARP